MLVGLYSVRLYVRCTVLLLLIFMIAFVLLVFQIYSTPTVLIELDVEDLLMHI